MKLVCEECGSDQIQSKEWVWVNSAKLEGGYSGEREDNWCCKCEDHVYFTTEEKWLEHKKELDNEQ
jgi:hypothetical protein